MDDILIYTDGDLDEHWIKLQLVLARLEQAGLKLDLKKCEFGVKQTKYLGFIIKLGEGISVDPEKVAAVKGWEAPTSVKGVRSFVGFANFYREFIDSFSEIAEPLVSLTKKSANFYWEKAQQEAFERLKDLFIIAPILALWHEDRFTVLEADCAGYSMGGCLSQYDPQGRLRPIAYFSKKLSPAECNYDIHDKELLVIVRCLEEWRGELVGLTQPFVILSDHRNLQYFMTSRKLSERQVRWSQVLSQFDFRLKFRAGEDSQRPDALSRREQDMPHGVDDDRLKEREFQLLKDNWLIELPGAETTHANICVAQTIQAQGNHQIVSRGEKEIPSGPDLFQEPELQQLWDQGKERDKDFVQLYHSVRRGDRKFPSDLKVSTAECDFDPRGALRFRKRVWVPNWEPLQTALIQKTHDSHITGHPGRDSTLAILSRSFFWPGASKAVRRFSRNCDVCGHAHVWRERRKGLLLPLPIPDRFFSELSIDFMTEMPAKTKTDARFLMVITDRLTKAVLLEPMTSMKAEDCAERFLQAYYRFHAFPRAITSDRGSNWVGDFWRHLCKLVGIEQRLSTAFHPETDGSTERMNQEVLAYLRAFISYAQFDWPQLLPTAMLAINNRDTVLGISPFFLTHGYHAEPIQQTEPMATETALSNPAQRAEAFVTRIKEAQEFAAAAMASVQQRMEESANKSRSPAERFEVGDRVWLNLKNISTPQIKKKLAWLHAKYRVTKVVSPHVVQLDVPSGVWPNFHVELLHRAATDPLPSQQVQDEQPPPLIPETGDQEAEYEVEKILRAERRRRGRGWRRIVLVKWRGYEEPNWEPRSELKETQALAEFESLYGTGDDVGEAEGARQGPSTGGRG